MPKLDCERVQHLLSDHLDGVLSPDISSQLEEHLLSCGPCRTNFESIRNLVGLAKDPRAFATPEGFSKRLYSKLEAFQREGAAARVPEEAPIGITEDSVPVGSHLIHFWQTQSEFERGVRFLYPGLGKDEHCIIFGHVEALDNVKNVLRENGYDPEKLIRDRKLTVLTRHACAKTTLAEIGAAVEAALASGARLVRFLGNLGLGAAPLPAGEDDVLQLESNATALIGNLPAIIVCMYDVRTVPGRLIFQGGLQTHSLSVCSDGIRDNPFYRAELDHGGHIQ